MKTFIRRPGNKTKHLKHIIPLIPKFSGTYIEPFLGTGAVYLHLLPPKAILNDLNKDIIDIWKLVKSLFTQQILNFSSLQDLPRIENHSEELKVYEQVHSIFLFYFYKL